MLRQFERNLPSLKLTTAVVEATSAVSAPADDELIVLNDQPSEKNEATVAAAPTNGEANGTAGLKYFNEDIVCPHNKLSTTSNKRLIHPSLWQFFYKYFKTDPLFLRTNDYTSDAPECAECLVI